MSTGHKEGISTLSIFRVDRLNDWINGLGTRNWSNNFSSGLFRYFWLPVSHCWLLCRIHWESQLALIITSCHSCHLTTVSFTRFVSCDLHKICQLWNSQDLSVVNFTRFDSSSLHNIWHPHFDLLWIFCFLAGAVLLIRRTRSKKICNGRE